MDGKEITYTEKFDRLAKSDEGEIVAVILSSEGEEYPVNEMDLLESYQEAVAHYAKMPQSLKEYDLIAVDLQARAEIQDYKIRHNIPLDTPRTVNPMKSANDEEVYSASVHTLDL